MTLILVAVDETEESLAAAREARDLFGPDAAYLAVNVAEQPVGWTGAPTAWGAVYPYPYAAPYPLVEEELDPGPREAAVADARETAQELAGEAGIPAAAAVGEIGDPASAIIDAAEHHHADVIVVGITHKGWWRRLIEGSVGNEVVKRAHCPVLIAGQRSTATD